MADTIAEQLKEMPATGIYGDDAEGDDDSPLTSLWDEFRYEQEHGPHDEQLEWAWPETMWPFLEVAVDAL